MAEKEVIKVCISKVCLLTRECKRHRKSGMSFNPNVEIAFRDYSDTENYEMNDTCPYFVPKRGEE